MARRHVTGGTRTETRMPDGTPIIERQHNVEHRHPHPSQNGRLVATRGLNLVLTETGETFHECDECGWIAEKAGSVVAHMTGHNPSKSEPDHDLPVLKTVCKIVAKYKRARVRGYCEKAATELNDLGVKNMSGKPWTASQVSYLWKRWGSDPLVKPARTSRAVPLEGGGQVVAAAEVETHPTRAQAARAASRRRGSSDPHGDLLTVIEMLSEAGRTLQRVTTALAKGVTVSDSELDELRQKAARFDEISQMTRR